MSKATNLDSKIAIICANHIEYHIADFRDIVANASISEAKSNVSSLEDDIA